MKAIRTILLAGVLGVAGCSAAPPGTASSPSVASVAQGPTAGFGGTDLAWIEINIAMDEQLLPLLALVPTQSRSAAVKAIALQVKTFTDTELTTLRQLHDQAALPATNPHEGMPMPGMVTPEQVAAAAQLTGPAFDKVAVSQIKGHLEQSQNLAHSEDKSGVEPQTRGLALQVLRTRAQTLSTLPNAT